MCHEPDAQPPAATPARTRVAHAGFKTLTSRDGTAVASYFAWPARSSRLGVVILPDLRGLSSFYAQLAVRLADQRHPAIAIDYYGRSAGTDTGGRGDDFPQLQHLGQLKREQIQDDLAAAADRLRDPKGGGCAAVVALGFCMGGRSAFFASAPRFGLDGVIGFYGAPGAQPPYGPGPTEHADELAAPVLGLFGGADAGIPANAVQAFKEALTVAGVEHELVSYPGAPHGFFDVSHDEHAEACADAWRRVLAFLDRCTPTAVA